MRTSLISFHHPCWRQQSSCSMRDVLAAVLCSRLSKMTGFSSRRMSKRRKINQSLLLFASRDLIKVLNSILFQGCLRLGCFLTLEMPIEWRSKSYLYKNLALDVCKMLNVVLNCCIWFALCVFRM